MAHLRIVALVTRVTRGGNIFNNKIYIGDLASMSVTRPAAKYRDEYQEVPATLSSSQRRGGKSTRYERMTALVVVLASSE